MQSMQQPSDEPVVPMPVLVAADVQDALLVALRDLQRLEGLLNHATHNLLERFDDVTGQLDEPAAAQLATLDGARDTLRMAVMELQFHDMSSQLIAHIAKILQGCASQLAVATMGDDEGDDPQLLPQIPDRPNPVTQAEMDVGSIELF